MTAFRIDTDRLTITGLAIAAILPFLALSPVKAAPSQCATELQAITAQAASADPKVAAKALRAAHVAQKICAEGNRHEAGKKFAQARQMLDTGVQLADRR
jgi:hypothetical protein